MPGGLDVCEGQIRLERTEVEGGAISWGTTAPPSQGVADNHEELVHSISFLLQRGGVVPGCLALRACCPTTLCILRGYREKDVNMFF